MKIKIGIALIIVTFLVSLNPYTLLFVLPVFIFGCVILWWGKSSLPKKILFTIAPLLLWYPGFLGFMYLNFYLGPKLAQKIEFRMSDDFKGQVTVVFPVECGQAKRIENNREVIDIPEDGIVYYQGIIESGYINWTYKVLSESGDKTLIEFKPWNMSTEEKSEIKPDSIGVFVGGGWSTGSNTPKPEINYKARTLIIDEWGNRDIGYDGNYRDSLQRIFEEKIRECKKAYNTGYK